MPQKCHLFSPNLVRHLFEKDASCPGTGQAAILDLQDQFRGPQGTHSASQSMGTNPFVVCVRAWPVELSMGSSKRCISLSDHDAWRPLYNHWLIDWLIDWPLTCNKTDLRANVIRMIFSPHVISHKYRHWVVVYVHSKLWKHQHFEQRFSETMGQHNWIDPYCHINWKWPICSSIVYFGMLENSWLLGRKFLV